MPLPAEFIAHKRDGKRHADEDLRQWIQQYANDEIPDYQMAAWAMAVFLNGMTTDETAALTRSMLHSGQVMQWGSGATEPDRPVVDKHSTGGIGDKVSLILAPLLACCELRVPMISGRGLGPTGGTLDKLESIAGFQTQLSVERIQQIANETGCVIAGAGPEIAPADKRLYGLRDVTGTVPSIPLITASIMSKKLAEGLDALVLDVKWGSGAFMKTLERAEALAQSLVDTGRSMGVATTAILTDMNQPLGQWCGNAVEVEESLECLRGGGPTDLVEATLELGVDLLVGTGKFEAGQRRAAKDQLQQLLGSGAAMEAFERMVAAQGGDLNAARPLAPAQVLKAARDGHVNAIDTERIGYAIIDLGGGRRVQSDKIDFGVGLQMHIRLGDEVQTGQPLVTVLARSDEDHQRAATALAEAIVITDERPMKLPELIRQRIA